MTITYDLAWVFDQPLFGISNCTQHFAGTGTQTSATGQTATFFGTWSKTGGDCPTQLDGSIWHPDGPAYHTFVWTGDLVTLDDWVAHGNAADTLPVATNPSQHEQWYITEMAAPYDTGTNTADYAMTEDVIDIYGHLGHSVHFAFTTR